MTKPWKHLSEPEKTNRLNDVLGTLISLLAPQLGADGVLSLLSRLLGVRPEQLDAHLTAAADDIDGKETVQ